MERYATADRARLTAALARVPDAPRWVDTRGMLLSSRAAIHTAPGADLSREGFLVVVPDVSLVGVVGAPPAAELRETVRMLTGDVNVLAQSEDAAEVGQVLHGWKRRTAVIHVLPGVMPWESEEEPGVRVFTKETAPGLGHVPEHLRRELLDALQGRTTARFVPGALPDSYRLPAGGSVPMAAAWADRRPVAFCYPVWQTETRWDVSIDTLEEYRGRGLGARAARAMIRHMRHGRRAPVWGALESNAASRALAARLGFIETAGLAVFTAA